MARLAFTLQYRRDVLAIGNLLRHSWLRDMERAAERWNFTNRHGAAVHHSRQRVFQIVMLHPRLVTVVINRTAVAQRAFCINDDGLRCHRCTEVACQLSCCILHNRECVACLCDVGFYLRFRFVGVRIHRDKMNLLLAKFGVQAI